MPKVSIGMPLYNAQDYVEETIDSILAQDFADFELVISDNASEDRTEEICRAYAAADDRVRYERLDRNYGAARNYNIVFERSTGDYFKWAAYDDLMKPRFLSACLERFEAVEAGELRPSIVYPRTNLIDGEGGFIREDVYGMGSNARSAAARVFRAVRNMGPASPVFGLMPRETVERTRLIGSFVASDYVFLMEAAMLGPIVEVDELLFLRRMHANMSRASHRSVKDAARWFDPAAKTKLTETQTLIKEYAGSCFRTPGIGPMERVACCGAAWTAMCLNGVRRLRVKLGRYRRGLLSQKA